MIAAKEKKKKRRENDARKSTRLEDVGRKASIESVRKAETKRPKEMGRKRKRRKKEKRRGRRRKRGIVGRGEKGESVLREKCKMVPCGGNWDGGRKGKGEIWRKERELE